MGSVQVDVLVQVALRLKPYRAKNSKTPKLSMMNVKSMKSVNRMNRVNRATHLASRTCEIEPNDIPHFADISNW